MPSLDAADDLPPDSPGLPPISAAGGSLEATVASSLPMPRHERIGSYKLLKKIGEGGMGVVYLAEQEQPRRHVALKILKPGINPGALRRFEHETRALARLQHDGIARIYQAGQFGEGDQARPYFAMEFIDGRPLTVFADSQSLGIRQRLSLMVGVCRAVQHAHLHGVVHRDLKPANILVEKSGQPKVLDFGVALVGDDEQMRQTQQTAVGQLIGTVQYMSPEQAEAEPDKIDWRSDIYSLGVICHELLSGRRPHDLAGQSALSAIRIIREEEPTPLSALDKMFRGDLSNIVAKALDKNKDRRYQSAADLAADLERYLHDEPITARPAGRIYKFRKFAKRNKGKVGLAVVSFLALVVGIPLLAWAAIQRDRADLAEKEKIRLEGEGLVQAARLAAEHGKWREAVTNYDRALQAGHLDAIAMRLGKARALLELQETHRCAAEIERLAEAANRTERVGSVLLLRGEMLLGEDDAGAERFIRAALAQELPSGERAYARALLAETTPKAVAYLREVLALDPYHHRARVSLEFLLLFLARFDEAKSELYAHRVIFPDDDALPVLETLLLALEGKRSEAQASLARLKLRMGAADRTAFGEVVEFLCQFRNPAHRPDAMLGLPELGNEWQVVQPALRHLWPALTVRERANPLPPPRLALIARLPPRLRKNLEGLPRIPMKVAGNELDSMPMQVIEEVARAAEIHPEGTVAYLWALALFSGQRWEEANRAAEKAAELPALVPVYPAIMNLAASSKFGVYFSFQKQPDPLLLPRALEATLLSSRPAFFAAAATHGLYFSSRTALLPRAIANLREMLAAHQPHRLLNPVIAVQLAVIAKEYNLARQLLDDWERDAPGELSILQLRAHTERLAGAYLPALKAADELLKRKPDDTETLRTKEMAVQDLARKARPYLPDTPPKRKP